MRAVSRFTKRTYARWLQRGRREEIRRAIEEHYQSSVRLLSGGSRGRDDIYIVESSGQAVGVVRLINPHLHRKSLDRNMPFVTLDERSRLDREWHCYLVGSRNGLTPKPIWRTDDALLCEHITGERLSERLEKQPDHFWALVCAGAEVLHRLHVIGVTHMDASLANIIAENDRVRPHKVIDFEYGPHPLLNTAQQRSYDHLRLLESCIKFMPAGLEADCNRWAEKLEDLLDTETRGANLKPLAPALQRVLQSRAIISVLAEIFSDRHTLSTLTGE